MLLLPLIREEDATLSSVVALLVYAGLKKQKAPCIEEGQFTSPVTFAELI